MIVDPKLILICVGIECVHLGNNVWQSGWKFMAIIQIIIQTKDTKQ